MLIGISDPLGAKTDRLRCEVCQNLNLSPINTGPLRYAVATALTVYGIETLYYPLQMHHSYLVATALTVYGIETLECFKLKVAIVVATVLTVYGIETKIRLQHYPLSCSLQQSLPFTVLKLDYCKQTTEVVTGCNSPYRLRY